MKNILGLVQSAPCRIDVVFRDAGGAEYKKTAVVKGKGSDTEELPLYTNHDSVFGEASSAGAGAAAAARRGTAQGAAPHAPDPRAPPCGLAQLRMAAPH